ncbi:MAG: UDP-3-O-acyl-N-acetylglucosamine deacetylase [Thermodesulfobacteriota bacterium]
MYYCQRTVAGAVSCSGTGVHSGRTVNLTVKPAPPNHGIKFVRTDLSNAPSIPALFKMVTDTTSATVLGSNGAIVSTVEHLLATLAGLSIDNALIEIDSYEIPILDGSAFPFVTMIKQAGLQEQSAQRCFFVIKQPVTIEENGKKAAIYPDSVFKITYTIEYQNPLIGKQQLSLEVNETSFEKEVSRARTFGFYHEYQSLQSFGLARGGSLDNAVVIDGQSILNQDGLRYPDEFVRHKILDCIGDFSLLGMPLRGHIIAEKSGHQFNHKLLTRLFASRDCWETAFLNFPATQAGTEHDRSVKTLAL